MPKELSFPITKDGLIVPVQIGLPAAMLQACLASAQPFLASVTVQGLIDTGADATSIAPDVLTRLNLLPSARSG